MSGVDQPSFVQLNCMQLLLVRSWHFVGDSRSICSAQLLTQAPLTMHIVTALAPADILRPSLSFRSHSFLQTALQFPSKSLRSPRCPRASSHQRCAHCSLHGASLPAWQSPPHAALFTAQPCSETPENPAAEGASLSLSTTQQWQCITLAQRHPCTTTPARLNPADKLTSAPHEHAHTYA